MYVCAHYECVSTISTYVESLVIHTHVHTLQVDQHNRFVDMTYSGSDNKKWTVSPLEAHVDSTAIVFPTMYVCKLDIGFN